MHLRIPLFRLTLPRDGDTVDRAELGLQHCERCLQPVNVLAHSQEPLLADGGEPVQKLGRLHDEMVHKENRLAVRHGGVGIVHCNNDLLLFFIFPLTLFFPKTFEKKKKERERERNREKKKKKKKVDE